ncbi:MAG: hypothetical protein ABIK43_07180 [candidate division WOR-3 bacterium]
MRSVVAAIMLVSSMVLGGALYHIDQPLPVSLAHAEYFGAARFWGSSGLLVRLGVGLFERVTLGMSYSADRLLGAGSPVWSRSRPEFQARLALLREEGFIPDLLLGFESQGYDGLTGEEFVVPEKGGYLCAGKSIDISRTYCEFGISYHKGLDIFAVVNQSLLGELELIAEFDPVFGRGDTGKVGLLNVGLAATVVERVRMVFALRDMLGRYDQTRLNRVFEVSVVQHF